LLSLLLTVVVVVVVVVVVATDTNQQYKIDVKAFRMQSFCHPVMQ
jgi:hypothetical protein